MAANVTHEPRWTIPAWVPPVLGAIALFYGFGITFIFAATPTPCPRIAGAPVALHLAIWTVAPPLWFLFELSRYPPSASLERFKYTQELAAKLWAAVLVVMLYFFADGPLHKLAAAIAAQQ